MCLPKLRFPPRQRRRHQLPLRQLDTGLKKMHYFIIQTLNTPFSGELMSQLWTQHLYHVPKVTPYGKEHALHQRERARGKPLINMSTKATW